MLSLLQCSEQLLLAALEGIAGALLDTDWEAAPEQALLGLLGPPVLGLLDEGARIGTPVRNQALRLLNAVILSFREPRLCGSSQQVRGPCSATECSGGETATGPFCTGMTCEQARDSGGSCCNLFCSRVLECCNILHLKSNKLAAAGRGWAGAAQGWRAAGAAAARGCGA